MSEIMEIDVRNVHELIESDIDTLLVCAYEREDEFHQHELEGAISLADFRSREPSLSKDQIIIFYCACPHDEAALGKAKEYGKKGFKSASVLKGGVNTWKDAGFPVLEKV
jgi:rhodanese-related sulfurtransferase